MHFLSLIVCGLIALVIGLYLAVAITMLANYQSDETLLFNLKVAFTWPFWMKS